MTRRAQLARSQQMPEVSHRRCKAISKRGHVYEVRFARGRIHLVDFVRIQTKRLFAHDMFAVFRRGKAHRAMRKVRRGDNHRVDIVARANRFVVGAAGIDPPFLLASRDKIGIGIANGCQFRARVEFDGGHVVIIADRARTNNGNANRRVGRFRHGVSFAK